MNVSGIRPYEGFYHYNSKRVQQLQQEQLKISREAAEHNILSSDDEKNAGIEAAGATVRGQRFTSLDYAKQYDPKANVDKKDRDVSLNTLDVQKAVSEMEKDQVLQRYQYFVDAGKEQGATTAAAAARNTENFEL